MNIVMTGATGTIGRELVKMLDRNPENRIWLLRTDLCFPYPDGFYFWADRYMISQIDLVINCAAAAPRTRQKIDGTELQWYVNVLLPYWLCQLCVTRMRKGSRIINVSSQFAGDLDLSDVEFKTRPYDNKKVYRASKQALRMLTVGLSQDPRYKDVSVNSIHPGGVRSRLSDDLNIGADDTAQLAAESIYYLATSPEVEGITGKYFEYKQRVECQFAKDQDKINELIQLLKTY